MNNIYTFCPAGNIQHSTNMLGVGEFLLRVAEEDRANMDLPFFSKNMTIDNGLTKILVMASQDHNSRIDICSEVPEEGEEQVVDHRERMLHCRITLTLADDFYDGTVNYEDHCNDNFNGDLKDDGTVGWPYQKDPSFIAVEPIPVLEGDIPVEERTKTIILHITFNIDARHGITMEGLNGDEHFDTPVTDWKEAKEGDKGRRLSLEAAGKIIETISPWRKVDKLLDAEDNIIQIFKQEKRFQPSEDKENTTGFNQLMCSSIFPGYTEREEKIVDDYKYNSSHLSMTQRAFDHVLWLTEAIEKYESDYLTPYNEEGDRDEPFIKIHTIQDTSSYNDNIFEDVSDTNNHPFGNLNSEKLCYSYGVTMNVSTPFSWILTDFTPRTNDLVLIGDISSAATRNRIRYLRNYWLNPDSGDWELKTWYPDSKLVANILPYYIEAKSRQDIYEGFSSLTTDWQCYTREPANNMLSPNYYWTGEYYSFGESNHIRHPFLNRTWGDYMFDCRDSERVEEYWVDNPWYLRDNDAELYDIYEGEDAEGNDIDIFHYHDVPNRMILCVRSFFANTDDATQLPGKRRSYDIEFPPSAAAAGVSGWGNKLQENKEAETYDELDIETHQPLSVNNCPNFVTIKGDTVVVNLMSSIYAVANFPEVTGDKMILSPRHAGWFDSTDYENADSVEFIESKPVITDVDSVFGKRPWPAYLDGDWKYTNIYGAGVTVDYISSLRNKLVQYTDGELKALINGDTPYQFLNRALLGESIYSDSYEDPQWRIIPDEDTISEVEWREEDTPESHMIHCIYRALEAAGFDKHQPICDIRLEAELYEVMI